MDANEAQAAFHKAAANAVMTDPRLEGLGGTTRAQLHLLVIMTDLQMAAYEQGMRDARQLPLKKD